MNEFVEYLIQDLLGTIPNVTARAMFGGYGVYKNNKIFGIVIDDQLYLKADDTLAQKYTEAGAHPFTYQREGKTYSMKYFCVPEVILEDREILLEWTNLSIVSSSATPISKTNRKL